MRGFRVSGWLGVQSFGFRFWDLEAVNEQKSELILGKIQFLESTHLHIQTLTTYDATGVGMVSKLVLMSPASR